MAESIGERPERPRFFVSSVVDGFEEFREAARRGVEKAGCLAVLVNEDFPSLAISSRNACLDAVASCDYLLSIVGERGGWKAPSGLLVVEEEFDYARRRAIPVLLFVQRVPRDGETERFVTKISDYVDGSFRTTFVSPNELESQVARAVLERMRTAPASRVVERDLSAYFAPPRHEASSTTMLRVVVVPERDEEVLDPVRIASPEFAQQIFELGHASSIRLFSFTRAKSATVRDGTLAIEQTDRDGRHGESEVVRLEVSEAGALVIDANVTGRVQRGTEYSMLDSMVIALEDIESAMGTAMRFANALYDVLDPYRRHERFHLNIALRGLGYRVLERNPQPRSQMGMSMRSSDQVVAYEHARLIGRAALRDPSSEIERAVAVLTRKAAP